MRRLYTTNFTPGQISAEGFNHRFTAQEQATLTVSQLGDAFESAEGLMRAYLATDALKLSSVALLIRRFREKQYSNILSMGAGCCVLEHLLALGLPPSATVTAADHDAFAMDRASALFPRIQTVSFDFHRDDLGPFLSRLGITLDAIYFMGSSYVMDNDEFVRLFGQCAESGAKEIIDFVGGLIDWPTGMRCWLAERPLLRWLLRKGPLAPAGKFHGFGRTRSELRRLYRAAGLMIAEELRLDRPFSYAAVLQPK